MTHKIVHLRIYKQKVGVKGVATDENGKILNDNHLVKLTHDTKEWYNYIKHLKINCFVKVEVKGFLKEVKKDGSFEYEKVSESLLKEVHSALHGEVDRKLTPDEKIEMLEKKIEALSNGQDQKEKKEPKEDKPEIDPELAKAREEYMKAFGKKGHHSWNAETILKKIEEHKKEKV